MSSCLPLFVRGLSVVRTVQRTKVSALWFSKLPYRRAIVNFTTVTKNRPKACLIWLKFLPNQRTVLWATYSKSSNPIGQCAVAITTSTLTLTPWAHPINPNPANQIRALSCSVFSSYRKCIPNRKSVYSGLVRKPRLGRLTTTRVACSSSCSLVLKSKSTISVCTDVDGYTMSWCLPSLNSSRRTLLLLLLWSCFLFALAGWGSRISNHSSWSCGVVRDSVYRNTRFYIQ